MRDTSYIANDIDCEISEHEVISDGEKLAMKFSTKIFFEVALCESIVERIKLIW